MGLVCTTPAFKRSIPKVEELQVFPMTPRYRKPVKYAFALEYVLDHVKKLDEATAYLILNQYKLYDPQFKPLNKQGFNVVISGVYDALHHELGSNMLYACCNNIDMLFVMFDHKKVGWVSFQTFMCGFSITTKGTPQQRAILCYNAIDKKHQEIVLESELREFISYCLTSTKRYLNKEIVEVKNTSREEETEESHERTVNLIVLKRRGVAEVFDELERELAHSLIQQVYPSVKSGELIDRITRTQFLKLYEEREHIFTHLAVNTVSSFL
mmetsp:Transcript_18626/g.20717  ORF Transcript_18626/g.20717 Transcript_18626/m.20717 type:complete len:269 (+) Transcript_18626:74-880(+)